MKLREELRAQHDATLQAILAANGDLEERLRCASVSVFYDADADLLMVSFGESDGAVTETIDNRIALRTQVDTLKLIGIEILGFQAHAAEDPRYMRLFMDAIKTPGARFEMFASHSDRLADQIRELIPT